MVPGLVSVVMAALDEEEFIAEALESVLAQDYEPLEVIVVDDGSTDGTARIAAGFGVPVLRLAHRGASQARNAGLEAARGEFWTIFDADDVMPPGRIGRQVAYLKEHPEVGMVLGLTEAFATEGQLRPAHWNADWDDGPFPACAGTMLARRAALELVGPYDPERAMSYDVEWLARAKDAGVRAGHLEEICLRYRIHPGNSSADKPAVYQSMLEVLRESVRRQRLRPTD
ncbi:MAG TPA: glycosyltransferase family A protein [Solirubrobacteraceae bacterium]|jgi:glycosyltransferase involved in cell wall biosynthesis|nr:glycosyltransferase family A protein [Solirubrobacteraceae bacterium]